MTGEKAVVWRKMYISNRPQRASRPALGPVPFVEAAARLRVESPLPD